MRKKALFCLASLLLLFSLTVSTVDAATWVICQVTRLSSYSDDIIIRLVSSSWTGERYFTMDRTAVNAKENYATLLTAFSNDYQIIAYMLDDSFTEWSEVSRFYIDK